MAAVSPVLDCGYCLIGGMKMTRLICKNVGFSVGKFCIMPKKSWPPPSFRVSAHRLLPGKRANPSKEIIPVRDLLECTCDWKHTHREQNFITSLSSCHGPMRINMYRDQRCSSCYSPNTCVTLGRSCHLSYPPRPGSNVPAFIHSFIHYSSKCLSIAEVTDWQLFG